MELKAGLKNAIVSKIKEEETDDFIKVSFESFESDVFVKDLKKGKFSISDGGQIARIIESSMVVQDEEARKIVEFIEMKGFFCKEDCITKMSKVSDLYSDMLALLSIISFVFMMITFFEAVSDEKSGE
ncbi:MAG: hypothetical protein LBD41_07380 [Clostridiales Family XIII bacterium]|jgi:hypothetical protein|nr:hypothetical protein [Clostridiales Family XIII bacterium]